MKYTSQYSEKKKKKTFTLNRFKAIQNSLDYFIKREKNNSIVWSDSELWIRCIHCVDDNLMEDAKQA